MRILMCALVVLGSAGAAKAEDAQKLLAYCKAPPGSEERNFCLGYISGVAATLANLADLGALTGSPCVPEGTTRGQMADVVVGFIAANPEKTGWDAATYVVAALNRAWPPCNKRGK
jgi:hypothetical protein